MSRTPEFAIVLVVLVAIAGCGGSGGTKSATRRECTQLLAAVHSMGPVTSELIAIPNSDADALHRVAYAEKTTKTVLHRIEKTSANGAVAKSRAQVLSALNKLSRQLLTARIDLRTGRTQQQKSQGYVQLSSGPLDAAQAALIAACNR